MAEAQRLGLGDVYRPPMPRVDPARRSTRAPAPAGSLMITDAATVHPARLARGLRNALIERGVRVYEGTPVVRFDARRPAAETPGGVVMAGRAIVALNAWARDLREFLVDPLFVRGTFIVMSAPAPECLEAMGWTGGEGVYDLRTSLHYLRPTRDGRIAFGGSSFRVTGDRADAPRYGFDDDAASVLVRDFRRWFPTFDDVPLETSWGGPNRRGGTASAVLRDAAGRGHALRARVHRQRGWALSPRRERSCRASRSAPRTRRRRCRSPTATGCASAEPLFSIGERIVSRAMVRRDDRLDVGRPSGWLTDRLARLPRRLGYMLGP